MNRTMRSVMALAAVGGLLSLATPASAGLDLFVDVDKTKTVYVTVDLDVEKTVNVTVTLNETYEGATQPPPAHTLVGVQALYSPRALIEVEAVAIVQAAD